MRVLAGLALTVAVWVLALIGWAALILASGGAFSECDRGDCGALGEFTMEQTWPLVPFVLLAAAAFVAWAAVSRRN